MGSLLLERCIRAAQGAGAKLGDELWDALAPRLSSAEHKTPGIAADPYAFAQKLVAVLDAAPDALSELARLHVEDMYFVWGLCMSDRAAFARFEREFLAQLSHQVAGHHQLPPGELEQYVRTRLFVAAKERPARIHQYTGRGPFGAWLRMVGKRALLDLYRARGDNRASRELESPHVATDPELDYLKLRYAADFKIALEQALSRLDARQVTLLKLSFIEQLPAATIGVMYGVSSRTVQRWLLEVREAVLASTREALKARLSLSPSELDSLLGLMQSQLQVSLHRVLEAAKR